MTPSLRPIVLGALLVALVATLGPVVSPTWGWIAWLVTAGAGSALLAAYVGRRHVLPLERLATTVRPLARAPDTSAEDLALMVAFEFRDAVTRLDELSGESRRRQAALEHAADGVILVDEAGLVDYANPAARGLLGGRILELSRRLRSPDLERIVQTCNGGGVALVEDVTVRTPAQRRLLARAVPLPGGGVSLLLKDLSEAHRLDRVRRDFVANVSHELKTPVSGVRALAEVAAAALSDGNEPAAKRFIDRLQTEAERLSDLVSDLLDLSRVEAGRDLQLDDVDVRSVADSAADHVRSLAETKGLALRVEGPTLVVEADPSQLDMAVRNLVDNAVRYSDAGTVTIAVSRREGGTLIEVSDEGVGIPSDHLERIFERFYRVDKARSRATGGTGLGLAIVRHVAENHGGGVEVTSELGRGSTFRLVLPDGAPGRSGNAA